MTAIGLDTHKDTLAACAVDELGTALAEATFANDPAGHRALLGWATAMAPGSVVGVEGSHSYGAAVARWLGAAGLDVREVPPHLSRRERGRTRRAGKSDPGDALAIARVTIRERDLPPVRGADPTTELGLLVAARDDLVAEATRIRNRLHADLVVLVPGYGGRAANLVAEVHLARVSGMLRGRTDVHAELARERLAELRRTQRRVRSLATRIKGLVGDHPLLGLHGAAALTSAILIARAGDLARFRSADAFAMLAGLAPIPASSGQTRRMRLNRGGDRQLNRAFQTIAVCQAKSYPPAQAYVARKRAEGKSWRDAIRALKRQLVRTVFELLLAGRAQLAAAA